MTDTDNVVRLQRLMWEALQRDPDANYDDTVEALIQLTVFHMTIMEGNPWKRLSKRPPAGRNRNRPKTHGSGSSIAPPGRSKSG